MIKNGKPMTLNPRELEEFVQDRADDMLSTILSITKEHGVCFLRYTKEDGMIIIQPKFNSRLNGVIADA